MAGLRDLLVDEREFDQNAMADVLVEFVRLGSGGELRPGDGWETLSERAKVVAVLLAYKAAKALDLRGDESGSALEISQASGVAHGTVRPVLRGLLDEHLVQQPARGRYEVPSMRVSQALRVLRNGNGSFNGN